METSARLGILAVAADRPDDKQVLNMVIDCIPFFNELDILKLRLEVLNPLVDRFVIEEATRTFSGEPKELIFEKNKELFAPYLSKIDYVAVSDDVLMEDGVTVNPAADRYAPEIPGQELTHRRDYFQKNHLLDRLQDVTDRDVILFGDLDEIPNPRALQQILADFDPDKVYHLAQRNFYVFLNMEEKPVRLHSITGEFPDVPEAQRKWLGTKVCSLRSIPAEGIVRLRDLVPVTDARSVRVEDGGWHFGYMGGFREANVLRRIGTKIRAAAHQEYNDAEIIAETMDKLVLGQDIFGRSAHFEQVPVDDSYPAYLLAHQEEFQHLILPPVTGWKRFSCRLDLTAGRFCRKALRRIRRALCRENAD